MSASNFVDQRRALHALLTLKNGRRGNECSQIMLKDWHDRFSWISNDSKMTSSDKELLQKYIVIFVMGKNDKALPIFIPKFCELNLVGLADMEVRKAAGVLSENAIP